MDSRILYDENLMHRARTFGDGRKVHQLESFMFAYESAWANGQENGWDKENVALLDEAACELRKYLNAK